MLLSETNTHRQHRAARQQGKGGAAGTSGFLSRKSVPAALLCPHGALQILTEME